MDASSSSLQVDRVAVVYYFCSVQCQDNFLAHPALYVGKPLETSIKQRRFVLGMSLDCAQAMQLEQTMLQMMGIHGLQVDAEVVAIEYNLLEVTAGQIETALANAGASLGTGWSLRFKRGWVHYIEENELDNLAAGDIPCCNRPPAKG